jgi:beta-lactam-binding protein with PASTA domain
MSVKGFFLGCLKISLLAIGLFILGFLSALITMNIVAQGEQGKVPSLTGKNIAAALEEVTSLGLNLKIESQEFHRNFSPHTIISQKPEAGKVIKSGRTIRVILSKGTQMVTIPDVCGEPWLRAQTILQENDLKVGHLTKIYHQRVEKNVVICQDPPAHDQAEQGGIVNLLISEGREPKYYFMPEIAGRSLDEANRILRALPLKVSNIHYEFHEGLEPNIVIEQFPRAGHRVGTEDKITLHVSKEKSIQEEVGTYKVLQYTVPPGSRPRRVRIILREGREEKEIFYAKKEPGSQVELLVKTTSRTVAFIYLDDILVKEDHFK